MLNWRVIQMGIFAFFFVFSGVSTTSGQNADVIKAELEGAEERLDAKIDGAIDQINTKIDGVKNELNMKIDGVKNELNMKIDGVKNELNANINGIKSAVSVIQWIIGGIGVVFTIFLSFLGYLLNYYVKKVLPNMVQRESRDEGGTPTNLPQREKTDDEEYGDGKQPDYP